MTATTANSYPDPSHFAELPPDIAARLSKMTYNQLIDEASRLLTDVHEKLCTALGIEPAPLEDISKLTLEERLARGEAVCQKLGAIAFKANPSFTLDAMEKDLAAHDGSYFEAQDAIARAALPKTPSA